MAKDVLIADSDKATCRILQQYCFNMGCFNNLIFAFDGVMASNKLKNQKFDVIILDINLPKRSGVDILKEIFEDKRPLNLISNFIMISDLIEKEKLEKLVSFGAKNFLVKPIEEAAFQEKVLKILKAKIPTK